MSLIEFIVLLIVAAIAGAIGQALGGYRRDGFLLAVILGFLGAYLGTWLAGELGLPTILTVDIGGVSFPIVWAIIGAAIFVALVSLIGRGGGYRWGVTPPTRVVLTISLILALAAFLVSNGILSLPFSALSLLAAAYILLLLGNLFKGL
jgi:uncharacterized membrane protein YeaQ/YmgE (transglycosylase-associated protein family)